jgi:hypothetical protein
MKFDLSRISGAEARRYRVYLGLQPMRLAFEEATSRKDEEFGAWIM